MLTLALAAALMAADVPGGVAAEQPLLPKDVTYRVVSGRHEYFYPERARRQGVKGEAIVNCVVSDVGKLSDCSVESEAPSGYGFGEATLHLLSRFELARTSKDGRPTAGRKFRFPMKFALP